MKEKLILTTTQEGAPNLQDWFPDEMPTSLTGALSIAVPLVIAGVWKYLVQPRMQKLQNSFRRTLEKDIKIQEGLARLLDRTGTCRVLLYQAHNGTVYPQGNHVWKVSITHEVVEKGVSSFKYHGQNQLGIDFINAYPDLLKEGRCFIKTSEAAANALGTTSLEMDKLLSSGVENAFAILVKGYKKHEVFGFLVFHWTSASEVGDLDVLVDSAQSLVYLIKESPDGFLTNLFKGRAKVK